MLMVISSKLLLSLENKGKDMDKKIVYSSGVLETKYHAFNKFHADFGNGFYCTKFKDQAKKWAKTKARRSRSTKNAIINSYRFIDSDELKILKFESMSEEWLDFIIACRTGNNHDYDIVEGPMVDDTIFTYVNDFVKDEISKKAFWALVEFKHPTHQISFHTDKSLKYLKFEGSEVLDD